jgi:LacI family transcriptional regulator
MPEKTSRPPAADPAENGAPRPTLKSLAAHLGLSMATVSLVLSNSPLAQSLSHETRRRVHEAARQFNYRPNYFARGLMRKRSYLVGIVVPEIGQGYVAEILAGIERELSEDKYFYFVASHLWDPSLIKEVPSLLVERGAEGVILVNTALPEPLPVPVVTVGGKLAAQQAVNIQIDNATGVRAALSLLKQQGHSRIAFFKGHKGSADTEHRWHAIQTAARQLGLKVDPKLVVQLVKTSPDPSSEDEGFAAIKKLLARGEKFTALFAFNDVSAIGAMWGLRDSGLRIPEDVSVIGFDDVPAARFQVPRLTTVAQPLRTIGALSAKSLLQFLKNEGPVPAEIFVQPELVLRESTIALTASKPRAARKTKAVLPPPASMRRGRETATVGTSNYSLDNAPGCDS